MDEKTPHGGEPNGQCDDIKNLKILYTELKEKVVSLEDVLKGQATEIKAIAGFQEGTKVYVVEIKDQLDRMENRLFTFMGDLVKNLTTKDATIATTEAKKEEALEASKTKENIHKWDKLLDTLKAIFQIAAGAIAGYIVSKGGK